MSNHSDTHNPGHSSDHSAAVLDFPDIQTIDSQASEWLAKLDAEQPSPNDLAAFKQWVNADPEHRQAFEALVEFWDEMNILTQTILPRELLPQQPSATSNSLWHRLQALARPIINALTYTRAAGATALAILGLTVLLGGPTHYSTQIGQQKTIELADQSTVQLNTNSRLQVDYSNDLRRLTLTQGEAHFDVAHDPDRPFEVYVGNRLVRAIGTAFTVHVRKIDVEVIVTEGTVEIDQPSDPELNAKVSIIQAADTQAGTQAGTPIKATAGSLVTFNKDLINDVEIMVASQLQKQLSWRQGMLVFKGEPLQMVVDEVSRYTNLKIIIPERSAREMKVGGLFKVGDTESLFEALRDGFDIHVQEVSDDVVYLISSENR